MPAKPFRAVSAHTTHRNTPESDLQAEVQHDVDVSFTDGRPGITVRLYAACPMTALDKVNALPESVLLGLAI